MLIKIENLSAVLQCSCFSALKKKVLVSHYCFDLRSTLKTLQEQDETVEDAAHRDSQETVSLTE